MSSSQVSLFILLSAFSNISLQMTYLNTYNRTTSTKNINIKKENKIFFLNICENNIFCKIPSLSNCDFFYKDKINFSCFCHDKINTQKFLFKLNNKKCFITQCELDCLDKIEILNRFKKNKKINYLQKKNKNHFLNKNFDNQFIYRKNSPYLIKKFFGLKKKEKILNRPPKNFFLKKNKFINFELSKNNLFIRKKILSEDDKEIKKNRFYYKSENLLED